MAKQTKEVKRMGRRVMPKVRRQRAKGKSLTLGELIAAAFDVAGGDTKRATKLLSSRELAAVLGRRIVVA